MTSLCSGALAFWAKAKDNPRLTLIWRGLLFSIALWSFGRFGLGLATHREFGLVAVRFSYAASSWMGLLYVILCGMLVRKELPRWVVRVWGSLCGVLSVVAWTPLLVANVTPKLSFRFYDVPGGAVFQLFSAQYTLGIVAGLALLVYGVWRERGITRNRIRYVLLASVVGFVASWTTFPLVNDVQMYPFGVPLIALYPVLLTYGVVKHHVMDVNLAFRYATIWLAYIFLGLTVAVVPFTLLGVPVHKEWVLSAILAIACGPFLYRLAMPSITDLVDRLPWFRGRYLSRPAVVKALEGLYAVETLDQLPWAIVDRVKALVHARSCSVLIKDAGKPRFLVKAHYGLDPAQAVFLSLPYEGLLAKLLREDMTAIVAEYLPTGPQAIKSTETIRQELSFMHAAVVLPIMFRGDLHAVINIGDRDDDRPYNDVDIGHLNELARRSEHRLETLIAGMTHQQMTSMWAHDLVRPFSQKGSVHLIEMAADGAFGQVPPAVKAALELVSGDLGFVKFNLHQVLRPSDVVVFRILPTTLDVPYARIREKFKLEAVRHHINWTTDVPDVSVRVLCDSTIIEHRVLANLVENAFRHTPEGGAVTLGYSVENNVFLGFVRDTGPGIRKEDQDKLFQPGIQLNKAEGGTAGLGLASVKTVIESHRGRVWIESEWGKGASFFFSLPLDKKMHAA